MLATYRAIKEKGVLGMNARNDRYVNAQNPRALCNLVDNKVETKRIAEKADIPVPELYGTIAGALQMRNLPEMIDHPDGFVIKPAMGAQGNGILVVDGPLHRGWRLANGIRVSLSQLKYQVNNIISGMYSLGGQSDVAMVEYKVGFDTVFDKISFRGVPDIRVIVLKGIPVAAMLRLPTSESDGKANLHKGGLGVGISIISGVTGAGMQHDRPIDRHPDTAELLAGLEVPHWDDILMMAAKAYDVTGLGYLGVDVVLDRDRGPLLLEMNARPGISIQIAIGEGLRPRLERAEEMADPGASAAERVKLSKSLFD